jgi:4-hydroxy 2-oxovalerate aldolase
MDTISTIAQKLPKILECTLRDGAYVVDFKFTRQDAFKIAERLDALGFPLIEVGHGLGLGASEKGLGHAAATDLEYMQSAQEAVKKAKWGMFCIPGIASLDDVGLAASNGMGFIRIGTEANEVEKGKPYIEHALRLGMEVYCNLMKSYVLSHKDFARQVAKCFEYGASVVYLVDSAGGMLPKEIVDYYGAISDLRPNSSLGFHGHNNLGLAVANSLLCSELGFDIIDTSLQGLGRSAGNTPSSQFISALIRSGFDVCYDVVDVMQSGEELTRHLIKKQGYDTLDMTAGLALFHSGHLEKVLMTAELHQVDPRRLIIELCRLDKINASVEHLEMAAKEVKQKHPRIQ